MSPSQNRSRLFVAPLGSDPLLRLNRPEPWQLPTGAKLLAELSREDDRGWLIQLSNGNLAHLTNRGAWRTVDQRKARAAWASIA